MSPASVIPDDPAGVWPGVMGHEARRGGGRRTVLVIRQGARRADNSGILVVAAVIASMVGHAKFPDTMMDPGVIRGDRTDLTQ